MTSKDRRNDATIEVFQFARLPPRSVLIGANAVVVVDVPDDSIAVGVPAVVKPRHKWKER
jgi:hypothetical protein